MVEQSFHDRLADVLKEPSRVNLRKFVQQNFGEADNCECKLKWPEGAKLAKHILAIANSGGGAILAGFKDNNSRMEPVGVPVSLDHTELLHSIDRYIPNQLQSALKPLTIPYDQSEHQPLVGKTFQILIVPDLPRFIPFMPSVRATTCNGSMSTSVKTRLQSLLSMETFKPSSTGDWRMASSRPPNSISISTLSS